MKINSLLILTAALGAFDCHSRFLKEENIFRRPKIRPRSSARYGTSMRRGADGIITDSNGKKYISVKGQIRRLDKAGK